MSFSDIPDEELREDLQNLVRAHNQCMQTLNIRIAVLEALVQKQGEILALLSHPDTRAEDLFFSRKNPGPSASVTEIPGFD